MMTPTSKFADDGHAQQQQSFLPTTSHRRASSASGASSASAVGGTICSSVTLFPLHALQRLMQCFGYTHSVSMQSGRTYVMAPLWFCEMYSSTSILTACVIV